MYRNDPTSRPDRVLFAALAIVLATVSAVLGAASTYRPAVAVAATVVVEKAVALPSVQEMVLAEHRCLSDALLRSPRRGPGAKNGRRSGVHRMNAGHYGSSICAVVYEVRPQELPVLLHLQWRSEPSARGLRLE
jgi:hypothetical protein